MPNLAALLTAADPTAPAPAVPTATTTAGLDLLLAAEAPRLRRLVHRLLGWSTRGGDVDDVVQEVLLAAWRHRGAFRGEATWSTWLHRIALRKVQNHVRAATVRRRLFGWLVGEPPATPADTGPNDTRVLATRRALRHLAHRDREVLVLRYLEQREIPAIAELLRCSRAAVDARLSRARLRLRQVLDGDIDGEVTP
jgi:RNA polymerase sigma-70 factor (ECF subfamily)